MNSSSSASVSIDLKIILISDDFSDLDPPFWREVELSVSSVPTLIITFYPTLSEL